MNATGYGLTSGLESLDDRERQVWKEGIRAGNLYINRGTTGAIVLRQPFGGMGKSAFGPGIKAGGPNYVTQLMRFQETAPPEDSTRLADEHLFELDQALDAADPSIISPDERLNIKAALRSYATHARDEFGQEHDHFRLIGQDNVRRYLPVRELRIRVHPEDSAFEIVTRLCAAKSVGSRATMSTPPSLAANHLARRVVEWLDANTDSWAATVEFVDESDEALAELIRTGHTLRVRYAAEPRIPQVVRVAAADTGLYLAAAPVMMHGRLELLNYVEEQSISENYHRYGNLGSRGNEQRADTL